MPRSPPRPAHRGRRPARRTRADGPRPCAGYPAAKARAKRAPLLLEEAAASGEIAPKQIGLAPGAVASILMRAGHGAAYDATSTASHARHLTEMVRVLVAGLRAPRS